MSIRISKVKLFIIIALVLVFCFVPLVNMPYGVIVEKEVPEVYTTIEPYTVQKEVKEPYTTYIYQWEDARYPGSTLDSKGRWLTIPITKYKTVIKNVTEYREVTKTRLVYSLVVETRTKRVSILRYLLR